MDAMAASAPLTITLPGKVISRILGRLISGAKKVVAAATQKTSILDSIHLEDDDEARALATWCHDQDLSIKTICNYYQDWMILVNWHRQEYGDPLYLKDLTAHILVEWKRAMREARLEPATINRRLSAVRTACRMALDLGLRTDNPSTKIKNLPRVVVEPRSLDRNQRNALIRTCEREARPRDKAIAYLMMYCGLRLEDICTLDMRDVHLGDRKANIRIRDGKGGKDAVLKLTERPREALRAFLDVRGDLPHMNVFGSLRRSEGLSKDGVEYIVSRLGHKAGIGHITPHQLRHTYGKMMAEKGVHISVIMAAMRHSNIATTSRYITATQQDVDAAMDAIGGDE